MTLDMVNIVKRFELVMHSVWRKTLIKCVQLYHHEYKAAMDFRKTLPAVALGALAASLQWDFAAKAHLSTDGCMDLGILALRFISGSRILESLLVQLVCGVKRSLHSIIIIAANWHPLPLPFSPSHQ